jgi:hypothetical protein
MEETVKKEYIDTVTLHPELSDEELDELIMEENEKSAQLKEWPEA